MENVRVEGEEYRVQDIKTCLEQVLSVDWNMEWRDLSESMRKKINKGTKVFKIISRNQAEFPSSHVSKQNIVLL